MYSGLVLKIEWSGCAVGGNSRWQFPTIHSASDSSSGRIPQNGAPHSDLIFFYGIATRAADLAGLGGTIATVAVGGPEHPFKFELIDGDTVAVGRAHAIRRYL